VHAHSNNVLIESEDSGDFQVHIIVSVHV